MSWRGQTRRREGGEEQRKEEVRVEEKECEDEEKLEGAEKR